MNDNQIALVNCNLAIARLMKQVSDEYYGDNLITRDDQVRMFSTLVEASQVRTLRDYLHRITYNLAR